MSYADRLQKLVEYQTNIRSALEAKGATISSDATLKDFPSAVDTITGDYTGPTPVDFVENGMGAYVSMMSNATKIASQAFYYNQVITEANFPSASIIEEDAFAFASKLSKAYFPACKQIGLDAFYSCSRLESIVFPNLTLLSRRVFCNCPNITAVDMPNLSLASDSVFGFCSRLKSAYLPNLSGVLGACFFEGCHSIENISIPKVTELSTSAIYACYVLSKIVLPNVSKIKTENFNYCYNLYSVYLQYSSIVSLPSANLFFSTPFLGVWAAQYCTKPGVYGSIFVPYSLLDSYKSATNWVKYSDRFTAEVPFSVANLSESDSITAFVEGKESPIPLEVPSAEFTYSVYTKYPKYTGTQADIDENGEINISLPTEGVTLTVNTTPEDATVRITEDGIMNMYTKTKLLNSGDTVDYIAYKGIDETKNYYYAEEHNTITVNNNETVNVSLSPRVYDKVTAENVTTGSSDLKTSILTLFDVDGDALKSKLDCKNSKNESGYFVYTTPNTITKLRFSAYHATGDYLSYSSIVLRISTVLDENSYTSYGKLTPTAVLRDGNVLCVKVTQDKKEYEVELKPNTTYYFQEFYTCYGAGSLGSGFNMYIEDLVLYEDSGKVVPLFATNADKVYGLVNNKFSEGFLLTGDIEEFTYTAYADGKPKTTGTQADVDSSGVLNVTFPETGALLSITTIPESAECELIQDGVYSYLSKETLVNPGDVVTVNIKSQEINGIYYKSHSQTVTVENDTVINIVLEEGKIPKNITADNAAEYTTFIDGENFEISEGVIRSGSKSYHVNDGLSIGYITLKPEIDCRMTINYSINSEASFDYGVVMLTEEPKTFTRNNLKSVPANCIRLVYTNGDISNASSEPTVLLGGKTYYVYFAYTKDDSGNSSIDRFYIHSITFEL